ncbi:MAG: type II toxin-antitoxin system HicA family toxin [Elusimicrobiota bacterium]|jgi:predicted RNA binding protein YcfA (HicA-like mRNA interferase family)|nr:type II toxin-antitoxin system HicA family toxin [Elusimicrobiota bacterium]
MGFIDSVKLKEFEVFLNKYGYYKVRQKGSHRTYKNSKLNISFTIATHTKEVPSYIVNRAIKSIGLSRQEFEKEFKNI